MIRRRHVAAAAVLACLAMPAAAGATVYCVGAPACVSAGGTEEGGDGAALQKAFSAAAAHPNSGGPDQVLIGPGHFSRAGGLEYNGDEVVIRGAGQGSTVLTAPSTPGTVFNVQSSLGKVSDLTVEIPVGTTFIGINSNAAAIERVSILAPAGTPSATGLKTDGGSFSHGTIELPDGTGVLTGGGELRDTTVTAGRILSGTVITPVAIRRCRMTGKVGIELFNGSPTIEDTLVDLVGGGGPGVEIDANKASGTALLRHLTIVDGGAGSYGLEVMGQGAPASATLADSIVSGVDHPLVAWALKAGGAASLTSTYSSYEVGKDLSKGEEGAALPPLPADEHAVAATPSFISPLPGTPGDWRLRTDSALIDAGTPGALAAGESPTDLDGNARLVNGRSDVGAYEFRRRAPVPSATAASSSALVGQAVSFTASAEVPEAAAGDTIASYTWSFDDGASASGASVSHAFTAPGEHTATVTATDLLGLSATAVARVLVRPGLAACICPGPCAPGSGPLTASCPVSLKRFFLGLALAPSAFSIKPHTVRGRRIRPGAVVHFELTLASQVKLTIQRMSTGVRRGRKCVALTRRHAGRGTRRCTRYAPIAGAIVRAGHVGANTFRFTGKLHSKALAPGSYLLTAVATPTGGGRTETIDAHFRVLP